MLRREAAGWLARLQSGRDPDVERRFRRWYESDAVRAEAFDRVRRSYELSGLLRRSPPAAGALPEPTAGPAARTSRYAFAAAVALAVLVPAALLFRGVPIPGGTNAVMLMTRVGEIRQVRLSDGSRVTLDTATRVEVEIGGSRRRARLQHGRARFELIAAGEPFVLEAGSAIITTQRGVVDVVREAQHRRIDVLAGRADVRSTAAGNETRLSLPAGNGVTADAAGAVAKHAVSSGPDWTRGMLQFDSTPLTTAVAEANRYSERHIVAEGRLGQLRVTGAFHAGDLAGFARALAAAFHLSLRQAPDGNLVLSPREPAGIQNKNGG